VAAGRITADGFADLRALIAPAMRGTNRHRWYGAPDPMDRAGRWDALPIPSTDDQPEIPAKRDGHLEALARQLIARYGLVWRRVLERERSLPPWRGLLRAYWRLEAWGEVRGERFVTSFSGEQFAHPKAVTALRRHREPGPKTLIVVSATDPVNLTGLLTPGERVAAILGNRVFYRRGIPVAARMKGKLRTFVDLSTEEERRYGQLLTQERSKRHNIGHRRVMRSGR